MAMEELISIPLTLVLPPLIKINATGSKIMVFFISLLKKVAFTVYVFFLISAPNS